MASNATDDSKMEIQEKVDQKIGKSETPENEKSKTSETDKSPKAESPKTGKSPKAEISETPKSDKSPKPENTETPKSDKSPKTEKSKTPKSDKSPKKDKSSKTGDSEAPKESKVPLWAKEKNRLSNSTIEERRKGYFCGHKFVSIEEVKTWKEYYLEYREDFSEKVKDVKAEDFELSDKVSIYQGDITKLEIDAIVNAANNRLLGGGGVDGAIHKSAGDLLYDECYTLHGCETGQAKITSGYRLPAKNVIHTVGPVGEKPDLLKSCYQKSLDLMKENNLRTIAFPCISTGIYGYPNATAAPVAIATVKDFIKENPGLVDRVIFCLFLQKDVEIYEKEMQKYFPVKK